MSSSGENTCKDKYPGLCLENIDKCDFDIDEIRDAIRSDCPETCNVQFSSLDEFKSSPQEGYLSSAPVVGAVGGPMTRIHLIYYRCVASILKEKWDVLKSVEITTV